MKFHSIFAVLYIALLTYPVLAAIEPADLEASDGAARISALKDFYRLAYLGDILNDEFHDNLAFVKFTIEDARNSPRVYFIHTHNHSSHSGFAKHIGLPLLAVAIDRVDGTIAYRPGLIAPDGSQGMYTVEFDVDVMGRGLRLPGTSTKFWLSWSTTRRSFPVVLAFILGKRVSPIISISWLSSERWKCLFTEHKISSKK